MCLHSSNVTLHMNNYNDMSNIYFLCHNFYFIHQWQWVDIMMHCCHHAWKFSGLFRNSRFWGWKSALKKSKWVWSGNTTIINHRQSRGTTRKSRSTITRHQENKLSKATSSLFPIKMIAILKWTLSNVQQNIEQLQTLTMGVIINKKKKKQQKHRLRTDSSLSHQGGGGQNAYYWYQILALDSAVVEVQEMFSSHGGHLTNAMYHHGETF